MQNRPMLWQYIGLILSFSLRRSTIRTDIMQILAASALPAAAKFAGLKMPETASNDILAYIGLATIAFIVLRLLCAPYFIWREQVGNIGELRAELSRPERLVLAKLAKHRARARAKLTARLEEYQTLGFAAEWGDWSENQFSSQMTKIRSLEAEAGLSDAFKEGRRRLMVALLNEGKTPNSELPYARESQRILLLLQRYLIGDITAEALALQLPLGTAPKILP
jgi:hypothetical protein